MCLSVLHLILLYLLFNLIKSIRMLAYKLHRMGGKKLTNSLLIRIIVKIKFIG